MSPFSGATLMITGGTGSFGNTVLKQFLTADIGDIRIFSHNDKKSMAIASRFADANSYLCE